MTVQLVREDLETLVYLTNGCLEFTEHISAHTLEVWGMKVGHLTDAGELMDGRVPYPSVKGDYPLSVAEAAFTAEDTVQGPDVDLFLPYTGLVLSKTAGPVKVYLPQWEASYRTDEYPEGLESAVVLAALRRSQVRLTQALAGYGGVVTVDPDQDIGGGLFHHLLCAVPVDNVVGAFDGLEDWKRFLRAALPGPDEM